MKTNILTFKELKELLNKFPNEFDDLPAQIHLRTLNSKHETVVYAIGACSARIITDESSSQCIEIIVKS